MQREPPFAQPASNFSGLWFFLALGISTFVLLEVSPSFPGAI